MEELIKFFMDPLRLTLIVAGVAVLLAIIIFSRKSSKEFSFGSSQGNGNVSESLASEMLVDEEVIVLPRKQKESEVAEPAQERETAALSSSSTDQSNNNGYKIKTEPAHTKQRKSAGRKAGVLESEGLKPESLKPETFKTELNEFSAFQGTATGEKARSDIFEDDIIASPRPFVAYKPEKITANKTDSGLDEVPQFQRTSEIDIDVQALSEGKAQPVEPAPESKPSVSQHNKSLDEMFVVLHVIAVEGTPFNGLDIFDATKTLGLAFGKHAIFHYPMSAAPAGDSKFCLVNMSATGNFETSKISSLETNGISLIMRLPIRGADANTVFSNMVGVAQALARKLGGEILDQARTPLTTKIVEDLRADIAHFEISRKHATSKEPATEA